MNTCPACDDTDAVIWKWSPFDLTVIAQCERCEEVIAVLEVKQFITLARRTFTDFDSDLLAQREHEWNRRTVTDP